MGTENGTTTAQVGSNIYERDAAQTEHGMRPFFFARLTSSYRKTFVASLDIPSAHAKINDGLTTHPLYLKQ